MNRAILAVFVLGLAAVLIVNRSESIMGADASGYANLARMLERGETTRALPLSCRGCDPAWFTPLGFVPLGDGRMASFYPIGLPIHLALFARVGGWEHAPFFVSPLAGVALVLLTFWLGRRLHSELAGLIAAMLMGLCAVFVFQAVQPMSDVLAAAWSVAAIAAAVEGRSRPRFDLLAGFCFGVAVLVRPTSMLLLLPLAFALGGRLKPVLRFVAGGLPAAAILAWYNLDAFGSLLASGYSVGGATREFALAYFAPRATHYARWTTELFGPIAILAAVAGTRIASQRALLGTWFAAFFLFYSFYFSYDAWWFTRFLLPAYPAVAIAAGIGLARLVAWRRVAGVLLVILALAWDARQLARFQVLITDEDQQGSRAPVEWAARALPPRSPVFSMEFSGALLYYSGHQPVRWDLAPADLPVAPRTALLMEHEEAPFLAKFPAFRPLRSVAGGTLYVR